MASKFRIIKIEAFLHNFVVQLNEKIDI